MTTPLATTNAIGAAIDDLELEDQLELFAAPTTDAGALMRPRGPGRPPGARNKRTLRAVEWLLQRYKDPREVLLEIAQANVHDLAALVDCSALVALQEKRLAAAAVLPYVAQKQPIAVNVTGRQVVHLHIGELGISEGGDELTATILENVEFQEVSDAGDGDVAQDEVAQHSET